MPQNPVRMTRRMTSNRQDDRIHGHPADRSSISCHFAVHLTLILHSPFRVKIDFDTSLTNPDAQQKASHEERRTQVSTPHDCRCRRRQHRGTRLLHHPSPSKRAPRIRIRRWAPSRVHLPAPRNEPKTPSKKRGAQQNAARREHVQTSLCVPRQPPPPPTPNARSAAIAPRPSPVSPRSIRWRPWRKASLPRRCCSAPLLGNLPAHLLQQEVLRRLEPTALASLAGAGRGCAAAVAATALMQWAKRAKRIAPGHLLRLGVQSACSHAALCGNREVLEWLHNTGCPWGAMTARAAASGAPGGDEVAAQPWLPVG